jgi:hypothetical protein
VDGFDQEEACCECDNGREVSRRLLASSGNAFEVFDLADGLFEAGLSMVRSFVCYANDPNAPMLQEYHLIGSVRLEPMIATARYGRTTHPRPQRAIAMTRLLVVNIPPA